MWEGQLALADGGWRVIAPHFRGFDGGTGDPPAASIDDYAGDVIDLLDALHIKQAVIGGLSMGGYVAFAMLRHAAALRAGADPRRHARRRPTRPRASRAAREMLAARAATRGRRRSPTR